jgi:16S rRNA (cytidine1402-2'-O)-methyltransferase
MENANASAVANSTLYVVATPIGNLQDISQRAINVLQGVDVIAAEDTRHSARLLQHLGVSTRMVAYHDFSNERQEAALLQRLVEGQSIALISDAGTPLISDPGYGLVMRCRESGVTVVPIPGASALIAALSVAGAPSDRFVFEGFAPAKSGARQKYFAALADEARTLVFYESPHRIQASINDMAGAFGGDRQAVICRELTKTWETVHGDSLTNLCDWLASDDNQRKGEFVVIVHGAPAPDAAEVDEHAHRVLGILARELPLKQAAALASEITGAKKNALYQAGLSMAAEAQQD